MAAGLRRTVERGSYSGVCIDGYRVLVEVSADNAVSKRLEIDPVRAPLIRMIFARWSAPATPRSRQRTLVTAGGCGDSEGNVRRPSRCALRPRGSCASFATHATLG